MTENTRRVGDMQVKDRIRGVSHAGWSRLLLCVALGAASSAALAQGSASAGQTKATTCAACHGVDGNSAAAAWPSLAGQHASYIVRQLKAFQSGDRRDVSMSAFAQPLSEQDMLDLAAYYAPLTPKLGTADPDLVRLGERIYRGGIADRGVAACIACHGPTGKGNPLAAYPVIRGQHSEYVLNTLHAYASGERRSDAAMNQMMRNIAALLREDEMRALASYVQGLR
jgi:cytochrome c553